MKESNNLKLLHLEISLSGYVDGADRARVLEAGADGFLGKPFQVEERYAEVGHLLGHCPRSVPWLSASGQGPST